MRDEERTAVYRYFDAHGHLLYVGISGNPEARWKAHRWGPDRVHWVAEVARHTVEWAESRPEALSVEAAAIRAERPRYNGAHNYDEAPFDPASWPAVTGSKATAIAKLMRSEVLSGRWASGQRIPSLRTLGKAAGASIRLVSRASVQLQGEGLLEFQPGRGLFVREPM